MTDETWSVGESPWLIKAHRVIHISPNPLYFRVFDGSLSGVWHLTSDSRRGGVIMWEEVSDREGRELDRLVAQALDSGTYVRGDNWTGGK